MLLLFKLFFLDKKLKYFFSALLINQFVSNHLLGNITKSIVNKKFIFLVNLGQRMAFFILRNRCVSILLYY